MPFLALRALKPGHEHSRSTSRVCSHRSSWDSYFGRKMDSQFAIPGPSSTGNVLHSGKQGSKGLHQLFVLSTHNLQQNQGPTSNQSSSPPPREARGDGRTRKFSYWHQQGSGQEEQAWLQRAGREGKKRLQSRMILAFSHRKGHRQGLKPWVRPGSSPPVSAMVCQASPTSPFPSTLPAESPPEYSSQHFQVFLFLG